MENTNEQIYNIKDRIRQKPDLVINRVPENTLKQFKEFTNKSDFCEDFGFGLKFLMDFYIGLIPSGIEHLEIEVDALKEELTALKLSIQNKGKESQRKTLGPE